MTENAYQYLSDVPTAPLDDHAKRVWGSVGHMPIGRTTSGALVISTREFVEAFIPAGPDHIKNRVHADNPIGIVEGGCAFRFPLDAAECKLAGMSHPGAVEASLERVRPIQASDMRVVFKPGDTDG